MSAAGNDNTNANIDNIITIKSTKFYVPVLTLSVFIGMNIKQKARIKTREMNIDIFSNQILLESIDCLFLFIQIMVPMLKDLMLENIIYQKA